MAAVCFTKSDLQPRAPLGERQRTQILVALAQQIERDERRRLFVRTQDRLRRSIAGYRHVNPALQPLKPGRVSLGVERDDLAVEHDRTLRGCGPTRRARRPAPETVSSSRCRAATRSRTRARGFPGSISAMARMPSYFGSYTSDGSTSGGSDAGSVASIGRSVEAENTAAHSLPFDSLRSLRAGSRHQSHSPRPPTGLPALSERSESKGGLLISPHAV